MPRSIDRVSRRARAGRLIGCLAVVSALGAGCLARPGIAPTVVTTSSLGSLETGRVEVAVRWPDASRTAQTLPSDTTVLDLSVQEGSASVLATASISRAAGQTSATASLVASAGEGRSLTLSARSGLEVVASGQSATFTVQRNQTVQTRVSLSPTIQTYAGTVRGHSGDLGPASLAQLNGPWGISIGSDDSLYECESSGNVLRRVTPDGLIQPFLGDGTASVAAPDPNDEGRAALQTRCRHPLATYVTTTGDVYLTDQSATGSYNSRIRIVPATPGTRHGQTMAAGCVYTVYRGQDPTDGVAMVQDGAALAIAEMQHGRIASLGADGTISTLLGVPSGAAGDDQPGSSVDAAQATVNYAVGLARDPLGNLFFSEMNGRVRMLCRTQGSLYGIAAQAGRVYNVIVASQTPTSASWGATYRQIALDSAQNLYVIDSDAGRVYRCARADGTVEIIAGSGPGDSLGDGGPAREATFDGILSVAIDSRDRLYLAENYSHRIRRMHL